jgi:threonine/homoserine efflux transporter RhtA
MLTPTVVERVSLQTDPEQPMSVLLSLLPAAACPTSPVSLGQVAQLTHLNVALLSGQHPLSATAASFLFSISSSAKVGKTTPELNKIELNILLI